MHALFAFSNLIMHSYTRCIARELGILRKSIRLLKIILLPEWVHITNLWKDDEARVRYYSGMTPWILYRIV